jgi:hypothetical protein
MSFFEDASLVLIPSAYKDQKVYSVKPTDGTGDLTFSRASDATRVQSDGLIEKVRTNLATYSSDFSTAGSVIDATITTNTTTDPFGTSLADSLLEAATTGNHLWYRDFTVVSGLEMTYSIYVKSVGGRNVRIAGSTGTGSELAVVDLSNGSILASSGAVSVTSAGSGWYRISVTTTSTGTTVRFIAYAADGTSISYAGNITKGLFLFGQQLEYGVMTDYIATTTAAVSVGPVSGLPRLDYLGSTCPRLLLEPQRSSLVLYSEQMDNASWIKLNGAVTANTAVSPDGYTNADKFVPNATLGIHALRSNLFNQSATASQSWFVKADGYSKIAVRESELVGNYASFNLSTGALISTNQTGSIVNYGNGWYRCTLVDTTTGANAQTSIVVLPDSYTTGDPLINWSGDGTKGVLAYGCQVEVGAYATSYIPTLGASVTRVADAASKTGISSLFGANAGTIYFETIYYPETNTGGGERFVYAQEDTSAGFIRLWQDLVGGVQQFRMLVNDGGTQQVNASVNVSTFLSTTQPSAIKWAMAYEANRFVTYINGVQRMIDTSGTAPTISEINFNNTFQTLMPLAQALVFPTALSDAQLAELTA